MTGRIAFWLLVPGLAATVVELGALIYRSGRPPYAGEMLDELVVWVATVVVLILLASMTIQAVLIARRPQSLTTRQLPTDVAVLQFTLYALTALWVTLLVQVRIGVLSVLFAMALISLSIALLVRIRAWRPAASQRVSELDLPLRVRVALWAYWLLALVGLMYAVSSFATPILDPGGNRAIVVLVALGLPLSALVPPLAVAAILLGVPFDYTAVASLPVLVNMAAVMLVLWPRSRVLLANWFFRLGGDEGSDSSQLRAHNADGR